MAQSRNEKDTLKIEDTERRESRGPQFESGKEFLEYERSRAERRRGEILHEVKARQKKKMPVWLDLVVSLLIIVIVIGVIFGAVKLFDMYISDYEEKTVEYTFVTPSIPAELQKGDALFVESEDGEGNVLYMGKIQSHRELSDGSIAVTVRLSVKYRPEDGYMNEEYRIAVGAKYPIKYGSDSFACEIVELVEVD